MPVKPPGLRQCQRLELKPAAGAERHYMRVGRSILGEQDRVHTMHGIEAWGEAPRTIGIVGDALAVLEHVEKHPVAVSHGLHPRSGARDRNRLYRTEDRGKDSRSKRCADAGGTRGYGLDRSIAR